MFVNFICFILGAFSGLLVTCLAVAAGKDDRNEY